MGEPIVNTISDQKTRISFIRHLLDDLKALELMLDKEMIESGITRIGAEQEFCLTDKNWRPSKKAQEVLQTINDPHFTTEIAQYNLEINLEPLKMIDDCFSVLENNLNTLLEKAKKAAEKHQTKVLLTGILPTISKKELSIEYMAPIKRYKALNDMVKKMRGADIHLHLRGVDDLSVRHDSVLFEGCNTSFQTHLQIAPDDFISSYNWAQAISGPVLSICTNSPLLLGRELWHETRIALFRQSIDTRQATFAVQDRQARVKFGHKWASGSAVDIFRDDVAYYKTMLIKNIEASSLEQVKQGKVPKLQALNLHNGTIYRWNRPCYGVGNGKPHFRIECRYISSGPTVVDEIANFVFWAGLMKGRPSQYDELAGKMDFRDAKANFIKAARTGKESVLCWMNTCYAAKDLVLNILMPIARSGLKKMEINPIDIDYYLSIIEERAKGTTGSNWIIGNYRKLKDEFKTDTSLVTLAASIYKNQQGKTPVSEWPDVSIVKKEKKVSTLVGHIMSTQLYTANENDLAELATSIMQWKNIHHLPVENNSKEFCGILTWVHVENQRKKMSYDENTLVSDIMVSDVIYASPTTKIEDAISLMEKHKIGCLPILQDKQLVGIISVKDLSPFLNA
ncbi:CBS domain-containing protein [Spongiivirga sp. MCCC 1A20706]|uniref:CBS domain-containing protein n=1 Tax=Spongiivirga sp. MCCC 1A20706 TaxID=3160963 RepID=UPI0039779FC6